MSSPGTLRVNLLAMLAWVLPAGFVAAVVGAVGLWNWIGNDGLVAIGFALPVAVLVVVVGALVLQRVVGRAIEQGHPNVGAVLAQTFVNIRMVNILVLMVLGAGLWHLLTLPTKPFFFCLTGLYLVMLLGEGWWVSRKLRRDFPSSGQSDSNA